MNRIVKPTKAISFEEALRNLASRLTGTPAAELPRTQEAIVQYMAEHVPTLDDVAEAITDDVAEAITQEVIARLGKTDGAVLAATEPQNGAKEGGGTSAPPVDETPQGGPQAATEDAPKPKTTRKTTK